MLETLKHELIVATDKIKEIVRVCVHVKVILYPGKSAGIRQRAQRRSLRIVLIDAAR